MAIHTGYCDSCYRGVVCQSKTVGGRNAGIRCHLAASVETNLLFHIIKIESYVVYIS